MSSPQIERLASFIKREYQTLFTEALADAIDGSDFDLESSFFSSQMIGLSRLSDADVAKLEDLNIRTVLAEALPANVVFRDLEFTSWAEDAANFSTLNISHPSFAQIFAVDKNYKIILQGFTEVSQSSKSIISIVQRDAKIDTRRRFYTTISEEMHQALTRLVDEAQIPALRALAFGLLQRHEKKSIALSPKAQILKRTITNSRSFKDRKGTVPFRVSNNLLEIAKSRPDGIVTQNPYRSLMRRALAMLSSNDILIRIDNRDKVLSNYIREYDETFSRSESEENAIILYAIGEDVARQAALDSDRAIDEKIDGEIMNFIQAFMVANAAYVQGFAAVKTMMEDIDRTRRSLVGLAELNSHEEWALLGAFVKSNHLFSDSTKNTIAQISGAIEAQGSQASVGLATIGLGTMRGSLQAMAGALLDGEFGEAGDIAKNAGKVAFRDVIRQGVESENLQQAIIVFITTHQSEVIWLSQNLPIYFSWLKPLVALAKVL